MSGNPKKKNPRAHVQKYKNSFAFKNDLYDHSDKIKMLNSMEISGVCQRCKDVIQWKITYKKYKTLTQPKTCVNCHEKAIKLAYRTLCDGCAKKKNVCSKCGASKEIIPRTYQMRPKEEILAMMRRKLKMLPERRRRTFYRYLDKMYDIPVRKKPRLRGLAPVEKQEGNEEFKNEDDTVENEDEIEVKDDELEDDEETDKQEKTTEETSKTETKEAAAPPAPKAPPGRTFNENYMQEIEDKIDELILSMPQRHKDKMNDYSDDDDLSGDDFDEDEGEEKDLAKKVDLIKIDQEK